MIYRPYTFDNRHLYEAEYLEADPVVPYDGISHVNTFYTAMENSEHDVSINRIF